MEPNKRLTAAVSKMDAEMMKCRKVERIEQSIEVAESLMLNIRESVAALKEELGSIERRRSFLEKEIKEIENQLIMEESINEELVLDEEVEVDGDEEAETEAGVEAKAGDGEVEERAVEDEELEDEKQ